jgi:phage baseplate assembly protein W
MVIKTRHFAYDLSNNISKGEIYDYDVITQSIETILTTMYGDRLFNPRFGSSLGGILFNTINSQTGEAVLDDVIKAINSIEKRITVFPNQAKMTISTDQRAVILDIPYAVKNTSVSIPGRFIKQINF